MKQHLLSWRYGIPLSAVVLAISGGSVPSALRADYARQDASNKPAKTHTHIPNVNPGVDGDKGSQTESKSKPEDPNPRPVDDRILTSLMAAPVVKQADAPSTGAGLAIIARCERLESDGRCELVSTFVSVFHSGLKLPVYRAHAPPLF